MKKIFILTNFQGYLKSYSPIIVVQGQLEMLTRAGYQPVLITNRGWDPPEASIFNQVENKQLTPVVIDGTDVDKKFEEDVEMLLGELENILEDNCVVLTHDLIFLPDYVKLNVAARQLAQKNPTIQWLHWVHSATNPGDLIKERAMFAGKYAEHLAEKFPNSTICYPNAYDIPRVALNFGYEEPDVVEIPHSVDPIEFMAPIVQHLYWDKELWKHEVMIVYPIRLDRGKYAEAHVYAMAGCKANDMTSHLVICDFQSTGDDKVVYRGDLKKLAKSLGVADRVTFLSEFDESAQMEVPKNVIYDLFTLSNIFLLSSKSETYSLIAHQAGMRGNLVILNQDFAPFRQIYGKNALYWQFDGANIAISGYNGEIKTEHSDILDYYRSRAINLKYHLENNPVLSFITWGRTIGTPEVRFKTHLEPLLNKDKNAEVFDNTASL